MAQQTEIQLYLERAHSALQQAQDNLNLGHYDVAVSRAYYACSMPQLHPLSSESKQGATPKRKRIVNKVALLRDRLRHPTLGLRSNWRRCRAVDEGSHLRSGYTDRQLPVRRHPGRGVNPKASRQQS